MRFATWIRSHARDAAGRRSSVSPGNGWWRDISSFIAPSYANTSGHRRMRERFRCRWIRSSEELEHLTPQWKAVWEEDQLATPFQTPGWLVPWWHCFGEELRSVAMFQGDELKGFLPFYVHREPQTGERHLLPLGVGTTDYLDGVFSPDCTAEDVKDAAELLCAEDDWDTLYITQARPGSKLLQALEQLGRGDSPLFATD